ncbi:hypothetical protein [Desulfonema ishimotonii]|nr:hypothetical protein [Desulfonema ishimotonii]
MQYYESSDRFLVVMAIAERQDGAIMKPPEGTGEDQFEGVPGGGV